MAEVLPTQPHLGMDIAKGRDTSGPLPNPCFVFPMQPEITSEASSHARIPSNADATGSRRSPGRSRPQRISINKLPAFDFSPAVSSPNDRTPSPARSPTRRTPPIHHGHRRNNSEYVGGDVTNGGPVLVSASPTKSEQPSESNTSGDGGATGGPSAVGTTSTEKEGLSHPPPGARLGPPTSRRGHAHRRSGAISSHDLSMILKPASEMKGGSAPTTPSDSMFQRPLPPELDRSISQPEPTTSTQESLVSASQDEQSPDAGLPRSSRVGFSDVLEFIPRPLSTISSETSSSMSTVRASHSVSNSITSVISGGNSSSPQSTIGARSGRRPTLEQDLSRVRPDTAGNSPPRASHDWQWDFSGLDSSVKRPSSAPAGGSPSKGANESSGPLIVETHRQAANDPFATSPVSMSPEMSYKTTSSPTSRAANFQAQRRRPFSPTMRPRTSPEPKVTKRQRKGRSWAGLLSRKAKHHDPRADFVNCRSPTPPLRQHTPEAEFSLDDVSFDEDTTCIIETASSEASKLPRIQTNYAAWKPRETSPLSETDSSASMLDIDAALESFDSPSTGPAFEDVISGGVSGSKRRMHSSGVTGGFAGPGMHYHRRAESAPEMETIDRSKFGFPRLGSNPTMAIEEEEEEDDEEESTSKPTNVSAKSDQEELQDDQAPGLGVNIVEAESNTDRPMQRGTRRPSKTFAENDNSATRSINKLDIPEEFSLVEIVGADEEPRFSVITKSSDESTITPTLSHDPLDTHPVTAPLDFAMPTPALTYDGTPETPSAVSSPDFSRTSFDMPRMHTASSSITDRATLNSSRAGDHVLTLHSSLDDVPSLTSSASTMASGHPPRISSSANTCSSADRSGSFSAPVPARTRPVSAGKRNSLASLTRLVGGGSYNRSKLNIEECVQPDSPEKTEKKKGNRISRLMKFWKSKEKASSS
ncbi:hypothetical protein HO133_002162 [Letharia lupina]|uniref:Cell wall proline rich protein n=1 Tax=Letharia lupina TaxID=560253 RepID=A0A8H6CD75_9LECA|nr:uncharacterized protein HO133_002162 [Letharia lupina]KAF6221307.1 hypothetical protein HO133_002162 [Letharia lupina]